MDERHFDLMVRLLDTSFFRDVRIVEFLKIPDNGGYAAQEWKLEGEPFLVKLIELNFEPETFRDALMYALRDIVDTGLVDGTAKEDLLTPLLFLKLGPKVDQLSSAGSDLQMRALNTSNPLGFIEIIQNAIPTRFRFKQVTDEIELRLATIKVPDITNRVGILRKKGLLSLSAKQRYYEVLDFLVEKYGLAIFPPTSRYSIRKARFEYLARLVSENGKMYGEVLKILNREEIQDLQYILKEKELRDTRDIFQFIAEEDGVENNLPRIVASILPEETELQHRRNYR